MREWKLDRIAGAAPSELTGSAWQMVQLRTAHDSVIRPDEIGVFSVEFGSDGKALVIGGCNRGSGSYSLTPPSGLAFGPLATTRVMCRPESISSRFLGDFSRMEAYQLVGGHLYVRLAGNGGVYEFAPDVKVATLDGSGEPALFVCTDTAGTRVRVQVVFNRGNPASVTITHRKKSSTLPQVESGSGTRYESPAGMFWNKGRAATMTWQGMNLTCKLIDE